MAALDARLFVRHDLLTTEAALSQRLAELLRARGPLAPVAATLEGWREVASLISRQEAVLAHQDGAWLQGGGAGLGPAHESLLERIARIALLGPDVAGQVRGQSDAALQRLRQQLAGVLRAGGDGGLLWLDASRRYAMSPQRLALRDQLAALLQEPFMAGAAAGVFPDVAPGPLGWDVQRLEQVLALRQDRKRFMRERLAAFPPPVRPAIARFVDRQLAQQAEAGTLAAMSVGHGIAELSPEPTAWRAQRRQVGKVQSLLVEFGARSRAEKLQTLLAGDVVERLALADQVLAESAPASSRLLDFGWWQGEGSPLLLAVGAADGMALRQALAQQAGRIDAVARRIAVVLEEGAQAAPGHPAVLRWQGIAAEMERYRGGRPDSSLLAMERSLLQLGPELQGGTCAERLAGVAPQGRGSDEFARRHRQILEALARRCGELRGAPGRASESAAIPFG
jgi:type VI secretion system protein ImpL